MTKKKVQVGWILFMTVWSIKWDFGQANFDAPSFEAAFQEIYDSETPFEKFGEELELALRKEVPTIVIEPPELAEQTRRWIAVGNFFHKAAVLCGSLSVLLYFVWPNKSTFYIPLSGCSVLCTTIYSISWQFDPCCKYQVETNKRRLARLSIRHPGTVVVLVRKDDTARKILHTSVSLISIGVTICGIYRHRS